MPALDDPHARIQLLQRELDARQRDRRRGPGWLVYVLVAMIAATVVSQFFVTRDAPTVTVDLPRSW